MKTIISSSKPVVAFSTIRVGDIFSDDPGHYYMKLLIGDDDEYNSVDLLHHNLMWFDDSQPVRRCEATMTIID